jgi:hypothetical protein
VSQYANRIQIKTVHRSNLLVNHRELQLDCNAYCTSIMRHYHSCLKC